MEQDRRRAPRYPFVASAEVVEANSGTKTTMKISELSLNGCYVETPNPMEKGVAVLIKAFKDSQFFEAPAKVIYSQPNHGMGLLFHDVKPYFAQILQKWLLAAMVTKKGQVPSS